MQKTNKSNNSIFHRKPNSIVSCPYPIVNRSSFQLFDVPYLMHHLRFLDFFDAVGDSIQQGLIANPISVFFERLIHRNRHFLRSFSRYFFVLIIFPVRPLFIALKRPVSSASSSVNSRTSMPIFLASSINSFRSFFDLLFKTAVSIVQSLKLPYNKSTSRYESSHRRQRVF